MSLSLWDWMTVLAGSSALISPVLLLQFSGNRGLTIDPAKLVVTLLQTQPLPHLAGIAERLKKPLDQGTKVLNLVVLTLILYAHFHPLKEVKLSGLLGMVVSIASLAAGYLLSGNSTEDHKVVAQTTGLPNVVVSMGVASANFAGTPALPAVVA